MSWLSETLDTVRALRTPESAILLAEFPKIIPEALPPASALLFYGTPGNVWTERIGVNKYHLLFHPPFHAALMMRDGIFHNVGRFRQDKYLPDQFKSKRRIDAVIFKGMTAEQVSLVMRAAETDTTVPRLIDVTDYGVLDFLHFGLPFIGRGKKPVCSANVVNLLSVAGVKCSEKAALDTAPWDIAQYAGARPDLCEIRTVWVGNDYGR